MKNFFKPLSIAILAMGTLLTSCGDETGLVDGGKDSTNHQLNVTANDLTPTIEINSQAGSEELVKIHFEGADKKMRRLYVTQNIEGQEPKLYDLTQLNVVQVNKDDNSVNLGDEHKREFSFDVNFEAPKEDGKTYVYKLWVTHGGFANLNSKGDIENPYFKNSYNNGAIGTIIINSGNGNPNASVKEFSVELNNAVKLFAPDSNGKTKTFVSILNGKTYKITQQDKNATDKNVIFTEAEKEENAQYVSYWDFGYYYVKGKANFASAYEYTQAFPYIDIEKISGLTQNNLNKFYFKKSNKDFNSVATNSDLSDVSATSQKVEDLKEGNLIEFVDGKSGVKGLIRIDEIKGTDGNKDYIKFSVKVQRVNLIKG